VAKVVKQASLRVGLTGGIASGKTLVAAMFEVLGAPVTFADTMARGLMEQTGAVRLQLSELLGEDIYKADGQLDRPALGARLFSEENLLHRVNAIVHPAVREAAQKWHQKHELTHPYTVYESALLFESGAADEFDVVVVVHAPQELRLARAMGRDGTDSKAVLARMAAQMSDADRLEQRAYFIINNGSQLLTRQVFDLHKSLLQRQPTQN